MVASVFGMTGRYTTIVLEVKKRSPLDGTLTIVCFLLMKKFGKDDLAVGHPLVSSYHEPYSADIVFGIRWEDLLKRTKLCRCEVSDESVATESNTNAGEMRKGRKALNLRIASLEGNSERQSFSTLYRPFWWSPSHSDDARLRPFYPHWTSADPLRSKVPQPKIEILWEGILQHAKPKRGNARFPYFPVRARRRPSANSWKTKFVNIGENRKNFLPVIGKVVRRVMVSHRRAARADTSEADGARFRNENNASRPGGAVMVL
ncbi:hypothetical protein EVAR_74476_1 [Eumeta japonica]|uniref:Uncharacterized protein n=1 Tax=Eumeta variegata TaxID=151549 RepID=A0A4C1TCJ0_EUMVA|nr:hypothetical protein EVAR_74476_1 [Eumeta japonica]